MSKANVKATEEEVLPPGFLAVRLDKFFAILAVTIGLVWQIAAGNHSYAPYILCPLILVLVISSFVARRGVRTFVKERGEVVITQTFSSAATSPEKNVLFREVPDLIDKGIDRALDGNQEENP